MIDRREILDMAARVSLRPDIVEKDYVLGWVLAGIYAHEDLAAKWLFKGGTCLKKCFFETYRFSEDLDFTLLDEDHIDDEFLRETFSEIGEWIYETTGIEMPSDKQDFDIFTNPRGNLACQGKLSYGGPISPRSGGWPRIKLDLIAAEHVVRPPVRVSIFHPYSDVPENGIEVLAYDYAEAFAEKFRALAERIRPRDLYDVVNLFRHTEALPEQASFLELFRAKCNFKGIEVPCLADLEVHRADVEAGWSTMLTHQLPALLPLDSFWNELPSIFAWLQGAPLPAPVAPFPTRGPQTVVLERVYAVGTATPTEQSFIETIRFAAANRLRIDLHYRDLEGRVTLRTVEPYSLRRSQVGEVRLMATQEVDGAERSFLLTGILGVSLTQRTFTPRYPIELSPMGPLFIPQSLSGLRPRVPRRSVPKRAKRTGPTYIFRCAACGKQFSRGTYDSVLRPHKNKSGWDCYGTYGVYVRTKY
jgi:predicted nucleotidyltransferase component of viral defense system